MAERYASFGGRRYAQRMSEERERERGRTDWRSGLRGSEQQVRENDERKAIFLRYSSQPARKSYDGRAFGDPEELPKKPKGPRTPRAELFSRLSSQTTEACSARAAEAAKKLAEASQREENAKRWSCSTHVAPKTVAQQEAGKEVVPQTKVIPSNKKERRYIAPRRIEEERRRDAQTRREASNSIAKQKEHHWAPAPVSLRPNEVQQPDMADHYQRNVRSRVFDWPVEQQERLQREKEEKEREELEEAQRLAQQSQRRERSLQRHRRRSLSAARRSESFGRSHSTPSTQRRGGAGGATPRSEDAVADYEIRRLQQENEGLRQYVSEMRSREQQLLREKTHPQQQQPPPPGPPPGASGFAVEHPLALLEAAWVPRKQIEEWQLRLPRSEYLHKACDVVVRYLDERKQYTVGVVSKPCDDEGPCVLVDTGSALERVRLFNVSNSCFKEAEVPPALLQNVRFATDDSNVFAHRR